MPVPPVVEKFIDDVDKHLHEPSRVTDVLGKLEKSTGGMFRRLKCEISINWAFQFAVCTLWAPSARFTPSTCSLATPLNFFAISAASYIPVTSGFVFFSILLSETLSLQHHGHRKCEQGWWYSMGQKKADVARNFGIFSWHIGSCSDCSMLSNSSPTPSPTIFPFIGFLRLAIFVTKAQTSQSLQCAFLVWLYLPQTLGAQQLYIRFIRPFHQKHGASINSAAKEAGDRESMMQSHLQTTNAMF